MDEVELAEWTMDDEVALKLKPVPEGRCKRAKKEQAAYCLLVFAAKVAGRRQLHSDILLPVVGREFVVEQFPSKASNRGLDETVSSKL